jgi:hypothetical protein
MVSISGGITPFPTQRGAAGHALWVRRGSPTRPIAPTIRNLPSSTPGKPWSEFDHRELKAELEQGRSLCETAYASSAVESDSSRGRIMRVG